MTLTRAQMLELLAGRLKARRQAGVRPKLTAGQARQWARTASELAGRDAAPARAERP